MPLEESQLTIVKEEAIAMLREIGKLTIERQENRCRLLAIFFTKLELEEIADAARHSALCRSTTVGADEDLIAKIEKL